MYEDSLTTEGLRKKFKNNFNLCNFSIQVGRNLISSGEPTGLKHILEIVSEKAEEDAKKSE